MAKRNRRKYDGLDYRQLQFQNSRKFKRFDKYNQKLLREAGYRNVGWDKCIFSYELLQTWVVKTKPSVLPPKPIINPVSDKDDKVIHISGRKPQTYEQQLAEVKLRLENQGQLIKHEVDTLKDFREDKENRVNKFKQKYGLV